MDTVVEAITTLKADYDGDADHRQRGFEIRHVAGGFRIFSRGDYHEVVKDFLTAGQSANPWPRSSSSPRSGSPGQAPAPRTMFITFIGGSSLLVATVIIAVTGTTNVHEALSSRSGQPNRR